jgi:hypothetical protein
MNSPDNHYCVQCGYCCSKGPCGYSKWDYKKKCCQYLVKGDPLVGTFKCSIYNKIMGFERGCEYGMMGSGCSSPLCNTIRNEVIQKMKGITNEARN